jgi:hypothetical protein
MKTLIMAASLATVLVSGCAALDDVYSKSSAGAGASTNTDAEHWTTSKNSPYPAETDAGIF